MIWKSLYNFFAYKIGFNIIEFETEISFSSFAFFLQGKLFYSQVNLFFIFF